jgi:hypothetical protein
MPGKRKEEVITFKVDEALSRAMRYIPNRSEFIRSAILSALDSVCPLCEGTGILTLDQHKHWNNFLKNHAIVQCKDCSAFHLVCSAEGNNGKKSLEVND